MAAAKLPKPCLINLHKLGPIFDLGLITYIAKTEFIRSPRHLTVANSEVITDERG